MEKPKFCPVPWCGKILKPSVQHYPLDSHVLCPTCLTEGPKKLTEAEAVAAWNSRPQSEVERMAREVVRLRSLFKLGQLNLGEAYDDSLRDLDAAVQEADRER